MSTVAPARPPRRWSAYVDCTPDAVPVISPFEQLKGVVLASGLSRHGFGLRPSVGRLAADLAVNDAPCVDPKPFRLERLIDGTKVEVGAI